MVANYSAAFGAKAIIWGSKSSRDNAINDGYQAAHSRQEFFSTCDIISLHLRVADTTKRVIRFDDLKLMKENPLFVNTARAELIEKGAIERCIEDGHPQFFALDVFENEPIFDTHHPYLQQANIICTPHIGYVEKESYELYFGIAFQNLQDWINENK